MLQIISVKGENFRSFKNFDFQIKEGLWVVKGDNKDDSSSDSNGSGKSTLFCDSIIWCLTGNTVGGLDSEDDVVNLKTKKDCLVEVTINDNGHLTKVTRTQRVSSPQRPRCKPIAIEAIGLLSRRYPHHCAP